MRFAKCHRTRWSQLVGAALFVLFITTSFSAQQQLTPPKVEGKVILGGANFGEEIPHGLVGTALRVYVTKRVSIEPEYLFLRHSENDQDQIFQVNVAYDFTEPTKRFVPYGILGAGVLRNKSRYYGNDFDTGAPRVFDTSFTTWTASIGVPQSQHPVRRSEYGPCGRFVALRARSPCPTEPRGRDCPC